MTRKSVSASISLTVLCVATLSLSAASYTWTGGGQNASQDKWNSALNWTPNTGVGYPSLTTDVANFGATVGKSTATPTLSGVTSIGEITFASGAAAFTITGTATGADTLTLRSVLDGGIQVGIRSSVGAATEEIFNVNTINLGANQTWINGAGTLTMNGNLLETLPSTTAYNLTIDNAGTVTLNQTHLHVGNGSTFKVTGSGVTTASGLITGEGSVMKSGSGTLAMSAANNYAGTTAVADGILRVSGAGQLGLGSVDITGGRIEANTLGGGALGTGSAINVNTGGELRLVQPVTTSRAVNLAGGALTQTTGASSFGDVTVSGPSALILGSSGSLTFHSLTGSGTLDISNWNGSSGTRIFVTDTDASLGFVSTGVSFGGVQGAAFININELAPLSAVPEPRAYAVSFAIALLGFAIVRRRLTASA